MSDVMDRAELTRHVFRRLTEPRFREKVSAVNPAGDRPLIFAVQSDQMIAVIRELEMHGGIANLAVPLLNGVMVVAMTTESVHEGVVESDSALDAGCTVGVFVERLFSDHPGGVGSTTYSFVVRHDGHTDSGTAELVAIG